MTQFINMVLLIVNIVSLVVIILIVPFGIYEQIMGPADAEKLLKKLHVPLSYKQVLIIEFVCLALAGITYICRAKLLGI